MREDEGARKNGMKKISGKKGRAENVNIEDALKDVILVVVVDEHHDQHLVFLRPKPRTEGCINSDG